MNISVAKYIWRSAEVRTALRKEAWRSLLFIVLYVGVTVIVRYIREKPIIEGVSSALLGASAIALFWSVSVVRTLRAVLREQGMLSR